MNSTVQVSRFHPTQLWADLHLFLEQGGSMLVVIMATTFILWLLILERHYYFNLRHKRVVLSTTTTWLQRRDKTSWSSQKIRQQLLSIVRIQTEKNLATIKLIVVIAPLMGLLGTVTGMIVVFQQITIFGAGDPKLMAGGISQALVTTVLGLLVAIPALLLHTWVNGYARRILHVLEEQSAGIVALKAEARLPQDSPSSNSSAA